MHILFNLIRFVDLNIVNTFSLLKNTNFSYRVHRPNDVMSKIKYIEILNENDD